jgi:hypothetical protein
MKRVREWCRVLVAGAVLATALRAAAPAAVPAVFRSHSHNDYLQARPLREALEHRTGSVEADVFLVGGELLVAHARDHATPDRTLQKLYLEPLRAWCDAHGGRVYRDGPPLLLLIDIKADAGAAYAELRHELQPFAAWLTRWQDGKTVPGAITVILSGERPRAEVAAETDRRVAIDGRLDDLADNPPAALVPLVSENWVKVFTWKGEGPMPAAEREKLRALAGRAHAQGRWLRFWGAPDLPACWREQFLAGVDFINTDQPAALEGFLNAHLR